MEMSSSSRSSRSSNGSISGSYSSTKSSFEPVKQEVERNVLKCPRCRSFYGSTKKTGNNSSKIPLIVNCGHTICEDCLSNYSRLGVFQCLICRKVTRLPQTDSKRLCEVFMPHYSLIGYLMWHQINSTPFNMPRFISTGVTVEGKSFGHGSSFENVDEIADTDSDYGGEDFIPKVVDFFYENCPQHSNSYKNIQCQTCETQECAYCFVEDHCGHKPIHLYKLSAEEDQKLKDVKPAVLKILKQLHATKRKLRQMHSSDDVAQTRDTITEYFNHLYGRLHLIEKGLKKDLSSTKVTNSTLNNDLVSSIKRVSQLLPRLDALDAKEVNVHAIIEEVEDLKRTPCLLHSGDGPKMSQVDHMIQFVPDEIFDHLDEYFSLKSVNDDDMSLIPVDDWEAISDIPEVEAEELTKVPDVKPNAPLARKQVVRTENIVNLPSTSAHNRLIQNNTNFKPSGGRVNNSKPEVCQVVVTHINDLYSFFVQKSCGRHSFDDMNKKMSKWQRVKPPRERISIGALYCINFKTKKANDWRRGKLTDILQNDVGEELFQVFYIDYGNGQIVKRSQMWELDTNLAFRYPYALHCKLHNPSEVPWDETLKTRFTEIVKNRGELTMKFIQKSQSQDPHVVDLFITNSLGGRSLISKLLLGESEQSSSTNTPNSSVANEPNGTPPTQIYKGPKLYKNSKKMVAGQSDDVVVGFIKDPDHIYVQCISNMGQLNDMKIKLAEYYESKGKTCLPVEYTNVVVKFDDVKFGKWHRAHVNSVCVDDKMTEVYFVDWGHTATVPWKNVRILVDLFTKMECQAIRVGLADISALRQNESWPNEVTEFLTRELCNDLSYYKMVVKESEPLKVGLFRNTPDGDVCINSALVQNGYAVSTGNISKTLIWQRQNDIEQLDMENMTCQLIKKSEEILKKEDDPELEKNIKTAITVVRCHNPDAILFKFNLNKSKEEKLYHDILVTYSEKRQNKPDWEVNEKCVIWCQEKQYMRGLIKAKLPDHRFTVYLYDQGLDITIKEKFIYVYDKYFDSRIYHPSFVYKCYLANIKPAGDSGNWSNLSVEILHKIFSTYKSIYIVKTAGNPEKKLMGVLMWYSLTTPGNALNPSEISYISINRTLLECGAAFRIPINVGPIDANEAKSSDEESATSEVKVDDSIDWNEIMEQEEKEPPITNWPHLNPIEDTEFNGTLKCIDSTGNCWIRTDAMEEMYKEMEKELKSCFESGEDILPFEGEWTPGSMCTIFYEDLWYRGTVNRVTTDGIIYAIMIDFGSEHIVPRDDLYKQFMYPEIPPMVVSVKLDNITTVNGEKEWEPVDVDELVSRITHRIQVEIVSQIENEAPKARIVLTDGTDLSDLAAEICPNLRKIVESKPKKKRNNRKHRNKNLSGPSSDMSTDENESIESTKEIFIHENKEKCDLNDVIPLEKLQLNSDRTSMRVSSIVKYNSVVLECLDNNRVDFVEQLALMEGEIHETFAELPEKMDVFVGEACICQKSDEKSYGRASIIDVDNLEHGYISVFLVDYGTIDIIPLHSIREIKPDWLELPVRFKLASLPVKVSKENQIDFVLHYMKNWLHRLVDVEIISNDPSLVVHLYSDEKLCYNDFIERGILSLQE